MCNPQPVIVHGKFHIYIWITSDLCRLQRDPLSRETYP